MDYTRIPVVGDSETFCGTCQKPFNSAKSALDHYQSQDHMKRKAASECPEQFGPYFCKMCLVPCNSSQNLREHEASPAHQLRRSRIVDGYNPRPQNSNSQEYYFDNMSGRGQCLICNIELTSNVHAQQHVSGRNHQKKKLSLNYEQNNSGEVPSSPVSIPVPDDLTCKICNISVTCADNMKQHLISEKHKKKASIFGNSTSAETHTPSAFESLLNVPGSNIVSVDEICSIISGKDPWSGLKLDDDLPSKNDRNLFCDVCQVHFTGPSNAEQHFASEKHKKRAMLPSTNFQTENFGHASKLLLPTGNRENIQNYNLQDTLANPTSPIANLPEYRFNGSTGYCFLCDTHLTSIAHKNQHIAGSKHRKAAAVRIPPPFLVQGQKEAHSSLDTDDPKSYVFENGRGRCFVCNIELTSASHAKQHLSGAKHAKAEQRIKGGNSGHEYPLSCDVCGISLSGQEPAQQHFTSQKHKQKAALKMAMKSGNSAGLWSNNPFNTTDKTHWVWCEVCDCVLNTTEQLRAHQTTPKHLAKKEKKENQALHSEISSTGSQEIERLMTELDIASANNSSQQEIEIIDRKVKLLLERREAILQKKTKNGVQVSIGTGIGQISREMLSTPSPNNINFNPKETGEENSNGQFSSRENKFSQFQTILQPFPPGIHVKSNQMSKPSNLEALLNNQVSLQKSENQTLQELKNSIQEPAQNPSSAQSSNLYSQINNPGKIQGAHFLNNKNVHSIVPNSINGTSQGNNRQFSFGTQMNQGRQTNQNQELRNSTSPEAMSPFPNDGRNAGYEDDNETNLDSDEEYEEDGADFFKDGLQMKKPKKKSILKNRQDKRSKMTNPFGEENEDVNEEFENDIRSRLGNSQRDEDEESSYSMHSTPSERLRNSQQNPNVNSGLQSLSTISETSALSHQFSGIGQIQKPKPQRSKSHKFYCEICGIPANTEKALNDHKKGAQHLQMVAQMKAPKTIFPPVEKSVGKNNVISATSLTKTSPRLYQMELYKKAMESDHVCFLPTGTGKTLVSVMVISAMLQINPYRPVLFLVDKTLLVIQQALYIMKEIGEKEYYRPMPLEEVTFEFETRKLKMAVFSGGIQKVESIPLWRHDIIVTTAAFCENLIMQESIRWEDFSLVVMDEVHHCTKRHPYSTLINNSHKSLDEAKRPKLLGLTASPAGQETVQRTMDMLNRLLENLGNVKIGITSGLQERNQLAEFQSSARLHVLCQPISKTENEFQIQLRIHLFHCYQKISKLCNSTVKIPGFPKPDDDISKLEELARNFEDDSRSSFSFMVDLMQSKNVSDKVGVDLLRMHIKKILLAISDMETGSLTFAIPELQKMMNAQKGDDFSIARKYGIPCDDLEKCIENWTTTRQWEGAGSDGFSQHASSFPELLKTLKDNRKINFSDVKEMALILVQTRCSAKILSTMLQSELGHLKVTHLVGHGQGSDDGMRVQKQKRTLQGIKANKYNIVVATSVAEEGVDIPECQLVISLNPPSNVTALVQMRGRARKHGSHFVIICNTEEKRDKINSLIKREQNMMEAAQKISQTQS